MHEHLDLNLENLDTLKISTNQKIVKHLQPLQSLLLSSLIIKINKVNKRQERILAITNKNILNIASPNSFLPNRIKRVMPLCKILGISEAKKQGEMTIHIDEEDDYRFMSVNFGKKIIETIAILYSRIMGTPLKIYEYNENSLQPYTTTKRQLRKGERKNPTVLPKLLDQQKINNQKQSKLVFNFQNVEHAKVMEQFQMIKVLGRGGYGKVILCKHKQNSKLYAIKILVLSSIRDQSEIQNVLAQRQLIQKAHHPFLIHLDFAYVSAEKIYLVMNFCVGGNLFERIGLQRYFDQERTKFYAAQVYLALEEIHRLGYAYRDLKPQNILIEANGYIKLADFGLALKLKKGEKVIDYSGTRLYLSPQILNKTGVSFAVDWWTFGILLYQMFYGFPPFFQLEQQKLFKQIQQKQPYFPADRQISQEFKDLIERLLQKNPQKRLGCNDDNEVENHVWFKDVEWQKLLQFKVKPFYVPLKESIQEFLLHKQKPIDTITPFDAEKIKMFRAKLDNFSYSPESFRKNSENTNVETTLSQAQKDYIHSFSRKT